MLRTVFFLVAGAFVIYLAFWALAVALHVIGYVLPHLFKFLAWVFRKLELAFAWVKLRCQSWSMMKVSSEPELAASEPEVTKDVPMSPETPVAPMCEAAEPASLNNIESAQPEPATDVSNDPPPVEVDAPSHEIEEKPAEPPLSVPPGECEAEVAPTVPQADLQVKSQTQPALNPVQDDAVQPHAATQPAVPVRIGNEPEKDAKRREAKPEGWGVVPSDELPPAVGRAPQSQKPLVESLTDLHITLNKTPGSFGDLVELFVKGRPIDGYSGNLSVSWVMHDWSSGSYVVRYAVGAGGPSRSEVISGNSLSAGNGWVNSHRFLSINTSQLQAFAQGHTLVHLEVRLSRPTDDAAPVVIKKASFQLELNIPNLGHGRHRTDREECLKIVVLLLRHVIRLPAGAHGVTGGQRKACQTSIMSVKKLMSGKESSYLSLVDMTMKQLVAPKLDDMLSNEALLHSSSELRCKLVEEAAYLVGLSPSPAGEEVVRLMAQRLSVPLPD